MDHQTPSALSIDHIFDRCGVAALSDLRSEQWQELYAALEKDQDAFLAKEELFRSPEYRWPRDALHWWSRVWEYPYVFRHLRAWQSRTVTVGDDVVVDLGSGVTFFPFSVAKLGYSVVCVDVDPVCATDLSRAAACVQHGQGDVQFRLSSHGEIPLDDGAADAIYCISVLEHIQDFTLTIREMARVLRSGGLAILTLDLDLRGDSQLSISKRQELRAHLGRYFRIGLPEQTIHPRDILTSASGPYPVRSPEGVALPWFLAKQYILKPLLGRRPTPMRPFELAVEGLVLERV